MSGRVYSNRNPMKFPLTGIVHLQFWKCDRCKRRTVFPTQNCESCGSPSFAKEEGVLLPYRVHDLGLSFENLS